jgi:hypothetical protein
MPLTNEAKDKYIAPDISAFTVATIEDLCGVSRNRMAGSRATG